MRTDAKAFTAQPPGMRAPQRIAASPHGMVATAHDQATRAGVQMLEQGGNAFDAAIAAALALGVCEPHASGLGGQTMVLYHAQGAAPGSDPGGRDPGKGTTVALDGSSRAPEAATAGNVPLKARRRGYTASTVPSTVATLGYLADEMAELAWPDLVRPAQRLAREGYRVSALQHRIQTGLADELRRHGAARTHLDKGNPFAPGALHLQPELAQTLRRLATHGWMDFYTGHVAQRIVKDMDRNGGLITARDLAHVPWPVARRPDLGKWHGQTVASFPPPGAGRVLLALLHILERSPSHVLDPETPRGAVFLCRAIERALMDHDKEPRDPARHQMTPHEMVHQDHARRHAIRLRQGLPGETTHLSVMDHAGNAVAVTQSIELFYGSCASTQGLGFLYNDYMSAFAPGDVPGHPYTLRPNAVPWSCVAPAILFARRRPVMVIGSPGSDRIAPAVAQVLLRMRSMSPYDAVAAPRLHAAPGHVASLEASRFRDDIIPALESDGFDVVCQDAHSLFHGCVQAVLRKGRGFIGVADPRRDGSARGPVDDGRGAGVRRPTRPDRREMRR